MFKIVMLFSLSSAGNCGVNTDIFIMCSSL